LHTKLGHDSKRRPNSVDQRLLHIDQPPSFDTGRNELLGMEETVQVAQEEQVVMEVMVVSVAMVVSVVVMEVTAEVAQEEQVVSVSVVVSAKEVLVAMGEEEVKVMECDRKCLVHRLD